VTTSRLGLAYQIDISLPALIVCLFLVQFKHTLPGISATVAKFPTWLVVLAKGGLHRIYHQNFQLFSPRAKHRHRRHRLHHPHRLRHPYRLRHARRLHHPHRHPHRSQSLNQDVYPWLIPTVLHNVR